MAPEDFQRIAPQIMDWIATTLRRHAPSARTVASAGFPRLARCYAPTTLARAKFIALADPPVPPLSSWGLAQFLDFEAMEPDGITYLDTYFVRSAAAGSERLHFHELIHVIQWQELGPERFLWLYADGLEKHGYRASPLEEMAYRAEAKFAGGLNFDAEGYVRSELEMTRDN